MKERYRLLLLSSVILFAFYFVYDLPSALNHHIGFASQQGIEYRITLLYSAYSLPNIVVPVFFGWITHIRKSTLAKLLCVLVFAGHSVFTLGVWRRSFRTMLVGRFLFGIGGESFAVIQNRLISYEFKGKELAFAMGLFSSIARLGTVSNFLLTPVLANMVGGMVPCFIGMALTAVGLGICFKINSSKRSHDVLKQKLIDIQRNNRLKDDDEGTGCFKDRISGILTTLQPRQSDDLAAGEDMSNPFFHDYSHEGTGSHPQAKPINPILSENPFSPWKSERRGEAMRSKLERATPKILFEESGTLFYEPVLEGRGTYHSAFCLLVAISFLFALAWAPFYNVAPILFQKRYGLDIVSSGNMMAIIEGMSLVLIIVTSTAADAYGLKLWFVAGGCVFLLLGHLGIFLDFVSPYMPVVMLGFAGPLMACYWPCIPSLVSEESLGTGFATMYCILNLAFTFSPMAVAFLASGDQSYNNVEIYMLTAGLCALVLIGALSYLDRKQSLGLNRRTPQEHTDI